ncbi:MAG: type II toxin-antitoxin system RelE/ParE family toxin [Treponema sp.]|nr:MAG: type II toxin-antitoxin system RelE/ParE family toxin [Treponema sp.]
MAKYQIAETDTFRKKIHTFPYSSLYQKITEYVYPILRENPFFGPNIKKLKGSLKEVYRFRIGDYRLFYTISQEKVILFIVDIESRKDSYKKR